MRIAMIALAAAGLWLGASTADAASITPNPVVETRGAGETGGPLEAELRLLSLSADTATFEVSVSVGTLTGLNVSLLFDLLGGINFIASASVVESGGVDATAGVSAGNGEAQFSFAGLGAGQVSDQLVVRWASPALEGWQGTVEFDNGYATLTDILVTADVPEPSALLALGAALGLLGLARRGAN